jgi:hypothetical protein
MELWEKIISTYPETAENNFAVFKDIIVLKDDGDGVAYIAKWEYSQPIPEGLTLGKPSA